MQEKILFIILGGLIISLLINVLTITLLYKKQSVTTNNDIENQEIKNKKNKDSKINSNIEAEIESKEDKKPKKGRLKQLFNKKN